MRFPRLEYWSWLPFLSWGKLPNPGTKPMSPAWAGGCFTTGPSTRAFGWFHEQWTRGVKCHYHHGTVVSRTKLGSVPFLKSVHQWHRLAGVSCVFFWNPPPLHMAILFPWAQILPDPGVGTWPQLGQPEPFHGIFGSGTLGAVSLFPLDLDEKQWSTQVRNKDPGKGYQRTFQEFLKASTPSCSSYSMRE